MKATKTRYVGTCPICEREQRLVGRQDMVHHGFRRPGHGSIQGDCWGVGRQAYELSCEATKEYREIVVNQLAMSELRLASLKSGEIKTLLRRSFLDPTKDKEVHVGDPFFKATLESAIANVESCVRSEKREVERLTRLIDGWKTQPVRTLNEDAVQVRLQVSRDARQKALQDKRNAKLADAVARYQKRIDSALRNRTTSVIASIFEFAPGKLRDIDRRGLSKMGALSLLERDHVWSAFGLTKDGSIAPEANDILGRMTYLQFHEGFPWPEGLV